MSTRSMMAVYKTVKSKLTEAEAYIYRHSDGYPGTADGKEYGVLPDILPFLEKFNGNRGLSDTAYATARLVQHLTNQADAHHAEFMRKRGKTPGGPDDIYAFVGFGICKNLAWDIDYFYHISPTAVIVYEAHFTDLPNGKIKADISKFKEIMRVPLKNKEVK